MKVFARELRWIACVCGLNREIGANPMRSRHCDGECWQLPLGVKPGKGAGAR